MKNEMKYCDFHTHSTRSDGELSRSELIESAIQNNIGALAITDHNIEFDDLEVLQEQYPDIKLINGAEVSTLYTVPSTNEQREIHIIAFDFDNSEYFHELLYQNRFDSSDYVNRIIQKLREAGLNANFTYADLKAELNQEFIGRMAIARKLVYLGLVYSVEEALDEYIGDFGKRTAYVKPDVSKYIPMEMAVNEIKNANGIPILCHPYSYDFSEEQVVQLIQDFKNCGGLAMETQYAVYTQQQREQLAKLANEYNLFQSAASDFHGRGKKGALDNQFPIDIYYQLMAAK